MKLLVEKYPNGYEEPNAKVRTSNREVATTFLSLETKNEGPIHGGHLRRGHDSMWGSCKTEVLMNDA